MAALNDNDDFRKRPRLPVQYELIDKDGNKIILTSPDGKVLRHLTFDTAVTAAEWAKKWWPDQEQDEYRTGKGWDISVVGAE